MTGVEKRVGLEQKQTTRGRPAAEYVVEAADPVA